MSALFGIIVARLTEYLSTSILFGAPLLLLYARGAAAGLPPSRSWAWRSAMLAAVGVVASTAVWVMLQCAAMSGDAAQATDPGALWSMLTETPFGWAALARLSASAAALLILSVGPGFSPAVRGMTAGLGAVAVASLAWSGHGAANEGALGLLHLAADVLHLLAAAAWVGALLALAVLVLRASSRASAGDLKSVQDGLAGFSGVGTLVVATLVLTGLVNSWFLIGPAHLGSLFTTDYGRLLMVKLAIFAAMLCLAAANRFLLTPRLARELGGVSTMGSAVRALRMSVLTETGLVILVLGAVSWLGTLMPPMAAT